MAKKKDQVAGFDKVDVEDASVDVVRVEVPEEPSEDFLKGQDEALLNYRATGQPGVYIDPLRDQEPDIAPELGIAPHPELANPAPPKGPFLGNDSKSPVTIPVEEKEEIGAQLREEAQERVDELNKANEEAHGEDAPPELSREDALNLHLTPDESQKSSSAVNPVQ